MEKPLTESSAITERQSEGFRDNIPFQDRKKAIRRAKEKREAFVEKVWQKEKKRLPVELIKKHKITEDLEGWQKYLRLGFEQDKYRNRYGFDDWSTKYLAQMLNIYEDEGIRVREEMGQFTKLKDRSFYEYYFGGGGIDPELWWGEKKDIDPDSLLVHSVSPLALSRAIKSGVVGRGGVAEVAMCQDRIVYDRGYIIIFQANELLDAGYPLLQIHEDSRDAEILKEWRSPVPIDINLARLIVPTSEIPDRANASKSQIATSYFGEDYLKGIERL